MLGGFGKVLAGALAGAGKGLAEKGVLDFNMRHQMAMERLRGDNRIADPVKPTELERQYEFVRSKYGPEAAAEFVQFGRGGVTSITTPDGGQYVGPPAYAPGMRPWTEQPDPQQAPVPAQATPSPISDDEGVALLTGAREQKIITPEDLARVSEALAPQGQGAVDAYLQRHGIQVGRIVNGRKYVQRGGDWYEVN